MSFSAYFGVNACGVVCIIGNGCVQCGSACVLSWQFRQSSVTGILFSIGEGVRDELWNRKPLAVSSRRRVNRQPRPNVIIGMELDASCTAGIVDCPLFITVSLQCEVG